ncbi:hypothetical protein BHM03_00019564 [Ensete ventricosum]|nr:hypothetical protein BHM03_00019564 [Ensete ventricosum]
MSRLGEKSSERASPSRPASQQHHIRAQIMISSGSATHEAGMSETTTRLPGYLLCLPSSRRPAMARVRAGAVLGMWGSASQRDRERENTTSLIIGSGTVQWQRSNPDWLLCVRAWVGARAAEEST